MKSKDRDASEEMLVPVSPIPPDLQKKAAQRLGIRLDGVRRLFNETFHAENPKLTKLQLPDAATPEPNQYESEAMSKRGSCADEVQGRGSGD